jgi:hypothetical protein
VYGPHVAIKDALNPLYRRFLPAFFDSPPIVEDKATCDRCVMLAPPGVPADSRAFFHPAIKCCTYHPRLANFLVGGVLEDDELDEGKRRMREVIARGVGVTPRWVAPSAKYSLLLEAARASSFGRAVSLRCPYYDPDPGACTVWKYRKSDCMSYFCKYDEAADGRRYWRAYEGYVSMLELRLSHFAMRAVSRDVSEPPEREEGELSLEELEDRAPDDYARWWGPWAGKEEAFYRACYAAVRDIADEDVARILAFEPEVPKRRLRVLEERYHAVVAPRVPERLKINPELEVFAGPEAGTHIVKSYTRYDPTLLPDAIYTLLPEFTAARTVAEVQEHILARDDTRFPDELVLQLYQKRILVAARATLEG